MLTLLVVCLTVFAFDVASRAAAPRPLHRALWLCVHEHERTAWNDSGDPYHGGLQMGRWFIDTYATAIIRQRLHLHGDPGEWTPLQQMQVAEHAYTLEARQGYSHLVAWFNGQWPPSVGRCGL